ncbi:MAG: hypothetical protein H6738_19600 [Alphaproteobacteria bacterium]|nr:hypothetical protein [Alphaproteobacteria bacterium]
MRVSVRSRARTELVLRAVLPVEDAGLPGWDTVDREVFWRHLEQDTAPTFVPGLELMLVALGWLTRMDRRYRRSFFRLSDGERRDVMAALDRRSDYVSRQLVATFKILACFAWFDAPHVRARYGVGR